MTDERDTAEEWERFDEGCAERGGYARVETYLRPGASGPELAQRLHDEGLIYAINRLVLHPLGLALGVNVRDLDRETMRGTVTGLSLHAWPDGEAGSYPDATHERNAEKLREAGVLDRAPVLRGLLGL